MPVDVLIYAEVDQRPGEQELRELDRRLKAAHATWRVYWPIDVDDLGRTWITLEDELAVFPEDVKDMQLPPTRRLIEVNLWTPTYERGYERGDLPTHVRIAEFLERELPGCRVWHTNDASCEYGLRLWPAEVRADELAYYRRVGHEPYDRRSR